MSTRTARRASSGRSRNVRTASGSDGGTYVSVVNSGFDQDADDVIDRIVDSTGGFALVLAAAKAYLEHGIDLNIVADRF